MNYTLKQWPAFKKFKREDFSPEQWSLRLISKLPIFGVLDQDKRVCKICGIEQLLTEFYTSGNGRYRVWQCRDCQMKRSGIKNVGKQRFALEIQNKGFRRCSQCAQIKPLADFYSLSNNSMKYTNECIVCCSARVDRCKHSEYNKEYYIKNKNSILERKRMRLRGDKL